MNLFLSVLYHLSRIALGAIFLYAGWVKARDPIAFAGSIANYEILPYSWNYLVAASLPYVELLAGALLIVNRRVRPAAVVIGGLNIVFIAALVSVMARGLDIDCGCFDPSGAGHTSAAQALVRDFGIMLLVILAFVLRGRTGDGGANTA